MTVPSPSRLQELAVQYSDGGVEAQDHAEVQQLLQASSLFRAEVRRAEGVRRLVSSLPRLTAPRLESRVMVDQIRRARRTDGAIHSLLSGLPRREAPPELRSEFIAAMRKERASRPALKLVAAESRHRSAKTVWVGSWGVRVASAAAAVLLVATVFGMRSVGRPRPVAPGVMAIHFKRDVTLPQNAVARIERIATSWGVAR